MPNEELIRALSQSTVGSILSQPEIDRVVEQLVNYDNPLRQNLPRKKGSGEAYNLNRRTPGSTAGQMVADTDDLVENTGSYAQTSFTYRTVGIRGKVTRKAQAIGRSYANVLADEMEAKANDFRDYEDYNLIWGQNPANSPIYGHGGNNDINGLHKVIDAGNVVLVTTSQAGGALTTELLDKAIDVIRGDAKMIIASLAGRRKINAVLQTSQRFVDKVEVKGGFKVLAYNDIPIFTSTNISDTMFFNGTDIVAISGSTPTTAIYVVDTTKVFVGELTPLTMMPLAKKSSQYDEFDIFEDISLVVRDVKGASRLVGIKST